MRYMVQSLIKASLWLLIASFIFSCSKDRIEENKNSYESMDSYLDSKKQEEQIFNITKEGECPITGKEGTKICINKSMLTPSIDWPYTIKLVELLNPKEMVYYQHSNTNTLGLLTSDGEVRVFAEKELSSLTISPGAGWSVEFPNKKQISQMELFNGEGINDAVNWGPSSANYVTSSDYGYLGVHNTFGWVSVSKQVKMTSSPTATISFTSETDELTNVITYIYLPEKKCLIQVFDQISRQIPVGETIKIIMLAINSNGDFYTSTNEQVISDNTTINVSLVHVTEQEMTIILDNL